MSSRDEPQMNADGAQIYIDRDEVDFLLSSALHLRFVPHGADMAMIEHEYETVDINVNMGPVHPATHGVFRMVLTVDGELVVDVEPVIGYMHRGGEKLSENLDYRQGIGIQDRTDYLGNMNCEQAYVMAAEKM